MVSTNVSQTAHDKIAVIGKKARAASLIMAKASSKQKNNVLLTLTDLLGKNLEDLLKANNLYIVALDFLHIYAFCITNGPRNHIYYATHTYFLSNGCSLRNRFTKIFVFS